MSHTPELKLENVPETTGPYSRLGGPTPRPWKKKTTDDGIFEIWHYPRSGRDAVRIAQVTREADADFMANSVLLAVKLGRLSRAVLPLATVRSLWGILTRWPRIRAALVELRQALMTPECEQSLESNARHYEETNRA